MAISQEITRLQNAKASLKTSINAKTDQQHQITDETIDDYSNFVDSITTGGGSVYTGHYDSSGLSQIGWSNSEVQFYQNNGVYWNEELDNYYKLKTNELSGDDSSQTRFIPKNTTKTNFSDYYKLIAVPQIDITNISSFKSMFLNCYCLSAVDLSNYNTTNITTAQDMFSSCWNLKHINLDNIITTNIQSMSGMFSACRSIKELDLSNFNTSNVTDMSYMFANMYFLEELDLSNFNTSRSTNMASMFSGCNKLKKLDLHNFSINSSITAMNNMFASCSNMLEIDLSNMQTYSNCNYKSMFSGCNSLRKLDIRKATFSSISSSKTTNLMYNVPNDCLIIVKNQTEKNFYTSSWPNLTNVKTVAEYEAM